MSSAAWDFLHDHIRSATQLEVLLLAVANAHETTAIQVAARFKIDLVYARVLLDDLVTEGLLVHEGDRYRFAGTGDQRGCVEEIGASYGSFGVRIRSAIHLGPRGERSAPDDGLNGT